MEKVCCLLDSFVDLRTFKTLPGGMKEKRTFLYHAVTFFFLLVSQGGSRKIKLEITLTLKTSSIQRSSDFVLSLYIIWDRIMDIILLTI